MTTATVDGETIIEACRELADMIPGMSSADVHGMACELSASDSPEDLAQGVIAVYQMAQERGMLEPGYVGLSASQDYGNQDYGDRDYVAASYGVGSEVLRLTNAYPQMFRDGPVGLAGGQTYTFDDSLPQPGQYHGQGGPDDIMARHPQLFGASSGVQAAGRNHRLSCAPDCAVDHSQPKKGGREHPEVAALLRRHEGLPMFGNAADDDGNSGNKTHRPKSAAARARERQAARPGHTSQRAY